MVLKAVIALHLYCLCILAVYCKNAMLSRKLSETGNEGLVVFCCSSHLLFDCVKKCRLSPHWCFVSLFTQIIVQIVSSGLHCSLAWLLFYFFYWERFFICGYRDNVDSSLIKDTSACVFQHPGVWGKIKWGVQGVYSFKWGENSILS